MEIEKFINAIVDYDGHVRSSVNHFNVILDINGNLRSSFMEF